MADPAALYRSNAFSNSDSGFSSGERTHDKPVASSLPVVTEGTSTQSSVLPLPPSHALAAVHTLPTLTGSGPQPSASSSASTSCIQPSSVTIPDIVAGALVINHIGTDNKAVKNWLIAMPTIHSVLIQPTSGIPSMAGPIQQLSRISTITTLKLDFALHADGWSALNDDTQGWLALSELLFSNTGLKKLDFSNQRIWSQHLYHIAYALGLTTTRTTLEVLDLTGNQACPRSFSFPEYMGKIGDAVADIISIKSRLSTLLAAWQSIDDEDAMAIAKALKNNTSLMTLVLADNKVGATGSAAIFDAIAKNRKSALTDLDLSGCKIDFSAAKRFAKLLEKNTSLANIAIGTVPDAESLAIVREGLSNNQTVVKLKFGCMPNPDEPFQKIRLQIDADLKRRKIAAACKSYTSTGTTSSTGNTGSPTNTSSTNTVSPVTYYKWD